MAGSEQLADHVEDEQRLHAIVGETLPHLGEGEIGKSAGMAEKCGVACRVAILADIFAIPSPDRQISVDCAPSEYNVYTSMLVA